MADGPSRTLKTRTYLGLVFSQFLAAFNDQAAHIIAVFYAGDMLVRFAKVQGLDEKKVVFLVPAMFVAPFFLFSPLAGVLADKYSKRNIVVFWKLAEVGIMAIALIGFALPQLATRGYGDPRTLAIWSASLVVTTVFLMGTHSAFFVPAKYGIMPEILHPTVLSKGNGFLEGTSFLAQILGTSFGGFLYGPMKPTFEHGHLQAGNAWIIGVVLFSLALIGAVASFFMGKVPPAAQDREFTLNPFEPLANNLRVIRHSRPLVLAVIGIAFFTFMTLFLRQGLLYEGETSKDLQEARSMAASAKLGDVPRRRPKVIVAPDGTETPSEEPTPPGAEEAEALVPGASQAQQAELRVALLVAFIGLGVGIGSWLAGYLSGAKVELGLVPVGGVFIALATAGLALVTKDGGSTGPTVACLILIGIAAGLYIVPLYTLLQHRAPKQSKGSLVATSNFLNSTAGLVAVAAFLVMTSLLENAVSLQYPIEIGELTPANAPARVDHLVAQMHVPRMLFLAAGVLTIAMLVLLRIQLPDFFLRSAAWLRSYGRAKFTIHHVHNIPGSGAAVLLTNAPRLADAIQVGSLVDRRIKYLVVEGTPGPIAAPQSTVAPSDGGDRITRFLARRAGYVVLDATALDGVDWQSLRQASSAALQSGNVLAISVSDEAPSAELERLLDDVRQGSLAPVIPVRYTVEPPGGGGPAQIQITVGTPLGTEISAAEARQTVAMLAAPA
jgi:acyl-[acyl-carrier-protein]-phospholipid O-acyltransferase/long-chain-fatty-acid--[acyl-carrier-protein] ligase